MSREPQTVHPPGRDLSALVERTAGPQPWRRVFHATNGVLIVLALELLAIPRAVAVGILAGVFVLLFSLDHLRLARRGLNILFFRLFRLFASPREEHHFASSTWYVLGVLLVVAAFPRSAAVSGILVLALADPAASYVGRRWGRTPLGKGSALGTITFALVAFGAMAPFAGVAPAALAAVVTAAVEALPWRVDDNLSVPVTAALTLWVAGLI